MSTIELNSPRALRDPRWLAYDAYVFDIDGTLLNSRDLVHYRAFQTALLDVYGCTRDVSEVPVHGNTDIGILRATARLCSIDDQTFEERLHEALAAMRRSAHANTIDFRLEICPAIPKLLETLRQRGKLLGVATGNLADIGWPKLASAQLKQYFNFGSFSDLAPSDSPYPTSASVSRRGSVYEQRSEDPFRIADELLQKVTAKIILVDIHAEATSEKVAMGFYLDGRVTAVLGTHTHVPTADERILPKGTAYQTDVGMTGPYDSVIGVQKELIINRFLTNLPVRFEAASGDVRFCAAIVDADEKTGHARWIQRVMLTDNA